VFSGDIGSIAVVDDQYPNAYALHGRGLATAFNMFTDPIRHRMLQYRSVSTFITVVMFVACTLFGLLLNDVTCVYVQLGAGFDWAQMPLLQACDIVVCKLPVHAAPPPEAGTIVLVCVNVPEPQVTLQPVVTQGVK